jgi:hypothetical protein
MSGQLSTGLEHPNYTGPDWHHFPVATFAGQHDTHIDTGEDYPTVTLASIFTMEPQAKSKMAGNAFLASVYRSYDARAHETQREHGSFVALVGDVDNGDLPLETIRVATERFADGAAWLVYSSAHSRDGDQRWRMVFPLDCECNFDDWFDAQSALFTYMESAGIPMDRALSRAAQPIYLPNVPEAYKDGTPLRDAYGDPIYYQSDSSGLAATGLDISRGIVAGGISSLRQQRAADDRERDALRKAAAERRANRPQREGANLIEQFNASNSIAMMLEMCGYTQSPRSADDWRSPLQTGETYATRIIEDKWISLSGSDAAAGLGHKHRAGCFGDAYDLYAHFKHGGDHREAYRALGREQRGAGSNVVRGRFPLDAPPAEDGDPGWQEVPDWVATSDPGGGAVLSAELSGNDLFDGPFDCPPVDLWARYEPPVLPLGFLPPVIERFAFAHSVTMGSDPAGLAMAALTACSAAIPDSVRLQVKRYDQTWVESARLWVALVGLPSSKKTPIMNAALRPLNKIDAELFRGYMASKDQYDALDAKERKTAERPIQRRARISDATVEAVQEVLKDSPEGVLSQQDELSGWFGAMDKYAAGKGAMADRGFWLQAFNGGPYALNRVARGAALIPNLSISILGGIQPDPLRRIVGESVDDGLIQRLLPVLLKPAAMGTDEPQDASVRQYEELIPRLWRLSASAFFGGATLLQFSDDAQEVRRRLEERHLEMVGAEVISPKMGAHFGKYDGIFARMCVLWHCIEHIDARPMPATVSGDTARRVEGFLHGFVVPSAVAFYSGTLGLSDDHDTLIELASFILAHGLTIVQHRDCQRATATLKALAVEQTRRLFEKLESLAWLEPVEPPKNSKTPRWRVNPTVHVLFAERGRNEKERREKARAAIQTVLAA